MPAIRRAVPADLEALLRIAQASPTSAQWPADEYKKLLAPGAQPERLVLVAEQDAEVAGFIVGREAAGEWEIENVVVSAAARRRGLGSRLVSEFVQQAGARGASNLFLEVRESNHAARALYEKCGFQPAGRRKSYYRDPTEDALVLRLALPGSPSKPGWKA